MDAYLCKDCNKIYPISELIHGLCEDCFNAFMETEEGEEWRRNLWGCDE